MATLAYRHEEIAPRELKPTLFELDGISRATVEAHYKLYQGYVAKRNEILGRLVAVDVYEHAYFLDYQTDRASYIDAFLNNLDWGVVNGWVDRYGITP